MPAAKGGSSRRREPARDKAIRLAPQAIIEGKGAQWLSKNAGVSLQVACDVLATASQKVHAKADRELGVLASQMREAAQTAVPAAVAVMQRGLAACERVVEVLERDIDRYGDAGIPGKHGETPASVVLASAAQKLAAALWGLGGSIKDLTGLKAAEEVAKKRAGEEAKKSQSPNPWVIDFEPLPMSDDLS